MEIRCCYIYRIVALNSLCVCMDCVSVFVFAWKMVEHGNAYIIIPKFLCKTSLSLSLSTAPRVCVLVYFPTLVAIVIFLPHACTMHRFQCRFCWKTYTHICTAYKMYNVVHMHAHSSIKEIIRAKVNKLNVVWTKCYLHFFPSFSSWSA